MKYRFMTLGSLALFMLFSAGAHAQEQDTARSRGRKPAPEMAAPETKEKAPVKQRAEGGKAGQAQKKGTEVESGVTRQALDADKPQPELDRRWIIKMKDEKGKKMPPRKPEVIAWTGREQQARCEAYLNGLQETFGKTRYYSVGGDACNTAGSARAFLDLVGKCEGDCPQGLLEAKGYSRQIIRNVEILHQLGQERCLESVRETGSPTRSTRPAVKDDKRPVRR